jgi:hypothetical protein
MSEAETALARTAITTLPNTTLDIFIIEFSRYLDLVGSNTH